MVETAGYAALQIIPSVRGIGAEMESQINGPAALAGRKAGVQLGQGVTSNAAATIRRGGSQLSGALSSVAQGAAAAGAGALAAGFSSALDLSKSTGEFQAKLGVTAKDAKRLGGVAGKVYSSGFGESMPEVSSAVSTVVQNMSWMRDASSKSLASVSKQAISTANILDIDVSEAARSAGQMVRTGLAGTATEAMDLLVKGAQRGGNAYNDLADTTQEYGTQFRDLGLSGKEAMGLIVQGMEGGAQSSDKVGDALKELNIRVKSLDTKAVDALGELGLNADAMASAFSKGGPKARAALDQILGKLGDVEDPATRNRLAFALLGTQAEDMAGALGNLDLSTAAGELGKVEGAAGKAAKAVEDTDAQKLASAWRELKTELGSELLPVLTSVASWVSQNTGTVKTAAIAVGVLGAAWGTYTLAAKTATAIAGVYNVGKGIAQGSVAGVQALGRVRDGFKSTTAAQSAFSGKAGALGGLVRKGWDGAAGAARSGGSKVAGAARTSWDAVSAATKSGSTRMAASAKSGWDTLRLKAMQGGDAVKSGATKAATSAKSGWDTLRLRAMYAGDAIKGAGTKAAGATKSGLTAAGTAAKTAGTAAATSAKNFGALALAQTRSAIAATRNTVATVATAVAQRAVRAATVTWTAVQWLLNAAMTANPLGLLVVGIGLAIGAVVLAYNKVGWFRTAVNSAFSAIGAAATWLYANAIKPAMGAISSALGFVRRNLWILLGAGPIGWIVYFGITIYKNFSKIRGIFSAVGRSAVSLWNTYLRPPLTATKNFVVGQVLPAFGRFRSGVGTAVGGVKSAISSMASAGRTALGWLRTGVSTTKRAFDTGQQGIGRALGKIKTAAKAPVRFVIESVYNDGIRKVWNFIGPKVGLGKLNPVKLPAGFRKGGIIPGSSTWRQGDDQLIAARRGEGMAISEAMRVPALRSELLTWNNIGVKGGTAALRRYAAGRRPAAGTPRPVRRVAEGAGYAKGGIIGAVSGFGKAVRGGFSGGLTGPVDAVAKPLISSMTTRFGREGLRGLPTRAVESIVEKMKAKIKTFTSLVASAGNSAAWVGLESASARLRRAARWVDTQVGRPYQWGGGGNPSWDCSGFMAGIENVIRGVPPGRRYTTMDFRGRSAPSGWVRGMRSPFEVGVQNGSSARGSHMAGTLLGVNVESSGSLGVHKGPTARGSRSSYFTDQYGFAPVAGDGQQPGRGGTRTYDDGGWLEPGYTQVHNGSGRPEAVYTAAQQDRLERLIAAVEQARGGAGLALTVQTGGRGDPDDVADGVMKGLRRATHGGLYPRAGVP